MYLSRNRQTSTRSLRRRRTPRLYNHSTQTPPNTFATGIALMSRSSKSIKAWRPHRTRLWALRRTVTTHPASRYATSHCHVSAGQTLTLPKYTKSTSTATVRNSGHGAEKITHTRTTITRYSVGRRRFFRRKSLLQNPTAPGLCREPNFINNPKIAHLKP